MNDFVNDSGGHVSDERGRHINIVKFLNGFTNFASTYSFAVKGNDLIIKHSRSCLPLWDNLWIKTAVTIFGNRNGNWLLLGL